MNVTISLTDTQGQVRTTRTNAFGYYRFGEMAAGETYIITAKGKRYTFSQSSQVINVNEDTLNINFIANPK
jgi:phage gp45-like